MLMYNLLEYSKNYFTTGSLWNYYRDEIDNVSGNASEGKSFKYKTTIVRITTERLARHGTPEDAYRSPQPAVPTLNVEIIIPLKYLRNFWRFLDSPLTKCEKELD